MAWTLEDRRKYAPAIQEMVRQGMLVRLARTMDTIDPQPKVGRERVWSTLTMLQALWHLARDGCTWRRLPEKFPPFTTVWSRLHRWRELAVLDRALAVLVACVRLARGRARRPTAAIIDTQSVRTGPQRGPRGYDAGKKVKGRKRHALADTDGRALLLHAYSADIQDRDAAGPLLSVSRRFWPFVQTAFADSAYDAKRVSAATDIMLEIVRKHPDQVGFVVQPRRWVVERFFAWINRNRRLAKDVEATIPSAVAFLYAASVMLLTRRLARAA